MHSDSRPMPGLRSLYWNDLLIRRGVNMAAFGAVIIAGMKWISQPVPNPVPENAVFDAAAAHYGTLAGLALVVLGLALFIWRYLRVKEILTNGISVRAKVEEIDVSTWTPSRDPTTGTQRASRHSYHITLRYAVHGVEKTTRLKLPGSGFTYGLHQGHEAEIIVLETAPKRLLIRSVYLGRA